MASDTPPASDPKKSAARKPAAKKAPAKEPAGQTSAAARTPSAKEGATQVDPTEDSREKFRQALEAKKSKGGYGNEAHLSGSSKGKGQAGKAGGKREFRRKSG